MSLLRRIRYFFHNLQYTDMWTLLYWKGDVLQCRIEISTPCQNMTKVDLLTCVAIGYSYGYIWLCKKVPENSPPISHTSTTQYSKPGHAQFGHCSPGHHAHWQEIWSGFNQIVDLLQTYVPEAPRWVCILLWKRWICTDTQDSSELSESKINT